MKKEDIKKVIVISPAAIALIWGVFGIIHIITHGYQSGADIHDITTIIWSIGFVVIIPISILVIFNIKLPRALSRPLAAVSILMALSYLAILFRLFFLSDNSGCLTYPWYIDLLIWVVLILFHAPAIITFAIYAIRPRPLKPTGQTILIFIGILCALITAAEIMKIEWHNRSINVARWQLHDENLSIRCRAIKTLGILGDKKSIPEIIPLLKDKDSTIRRDATRTLGWLNAKEAIPEIIKLLQDNDTDVRGAAVYTLGYFHATEAIPEINKLLQDNNADVRRWAEDALKKLSVPASEIEQAKQK